MPNDETWPRSALLAVCTFVILLAILLLLPRSDNKAHQLVMETTSALVFSAAIFSLRYAPLLPSQPRPFSLWHLVPSLLLAVLAYIPAVPLGFISDDFTHVLWARGPLLRILWEQFEHGQYGTFFRPLGFFSLAIDYRIWRLWAVGWHLTSLTLHVVTTVSVFFLGRELDCDPEVSGRAALLFAVLPVNTEAVAWVAARFDLLATLLMLASLTMYLHGRRQGSILSCAGAAVFFVLALLTKESAYALPVVLCAAEWLLFERRSWRTLSTFFLIAGGAVLYRLHALGSLGGYRAATGAPGSLSFGIASLLGLLVRAPSELLFAVNWQQPRVAWGCVLAAVTASLLLPLTLLKPHGTSRRVYAFALVWCFVGALSAQSLLMIPPTLTNTRVLYFSSVGAALFIALLLERLGDPAWRRGWTAALVICLLATTWHDIAAWKHASRITNDFLMEVKAEFPKPPADAQFVLHNMPPWTEGGVYLLLHRALADSLCLTYNRKDIRANRENEPTLAKRRPVIDIVWIGDWQGRRRPLIVRRDSAQN